MNKKIKINNLLRIFVIIALFLNIGSIIGSAEQTSIVYLYVGTGNIYVDGVYKGTPHGGLFTMTLPTYTTHTLRVTAIGYNEYSTTFRVVSGYMIIGVPMIPSAWSTTPTPISTPTPIKNPVPYYTPKPTSTPTPISNPVPYYTPKPTSTPAPTSSEKYIQINSEPTGAKVYYGTTFIGTAPFTYKVLYAQKITFKLPGYSDKVTYIEPLTRSPFKVYLTKSLI